MHATSWKRSLLTGVASLLLAAPPVDAAGDDQGRGRGRGRPQTPSTQRGALTRELPPGHHEPVFERGYDDGYERGLHDGRRGARYDPVESRDYRRADRGYADAYGSRDAYRTNYRAGFRQGYEDGYRDGTR